MKKKAPAFPRHSFHKAPKDRLHYKDRTPIPQSQNRKINYLTEVTKYAKTVKRDRVQYIQ
jgi:hypothetical protein